MSYHSPDFRDLGDPAVQHGDVDAAARIALGGEEVVRDVAADAWLVTTLSVTPSSVKLDTEVSVSIE